MNYIKHLNAVFRRFSQDPRLNPTHISLYMALFQLWNMNRFSSIFYVHREDLMKMSKIGSKVTYHRCLKNLNYWDYITYLPSHNPFKSSQIKMLIFCTTSETTNDPSDELLQGQAVIPLLKENKQIKKITKGSPYPLKNDVLEYFKKEKYPLLEAEKFYNHYNSLEWKTSGRAKIVNWKSTAKNWMIKAAEFKAPSKFKDNLMTTKHKDYDQPL